MKSPAKFVSLTSNDSPVCNVLAFNNIPAMPAASTELEQLLRSFGTSTTAFRKSKNFLKRNRGPHARKKRKVNGFIAFRAFYSRSIPGTARQRDLSSKLAQIWKSEPNSHIWNLYAIHYNATGGNKLFLAWLDESLGFNREGRTTSVTLLVYQGQLRNRVEDVFLSA